METRIEDKIILKTIDCILLLTHSDILCFERQDRVWIFTDAHRNCYHLPFATNSKFILSLSPSLVLINKSQIVNADYIYRVENFSLKCEVVVRNEKLNFVFSRRCYKEFSEKYLNKISPNNDAEPPL